jgi:hypothetical protein
MAVSMQSHFTLQRLTAGHSARNQMVLERTPCCWCTVAGTVSISVSASRWTHHLMPSPLSKSFQPSPIGNMQAVLNKFNVALQREFHF